MELLQLKYFCAAAQGESIVKVAKQYMVPPSSVSHTIAKLEGELGVQLFARRGNRIALNDCGRLFYAHISAALAKIEDAVVGVNDLDKKTVSLILREGASPMIGMIAAFKAAYPDFEVAFPMVNREQKGSFFLRISAKPFADEEDFHSVPFFTERILVAVPSASPLAEKDMLSFADIKAQPIIGFYKAPEQYWLDAYFKQHAYKPKVIIECSKDSSVAEFVRTGFGIAFCPELSTPSIHADGIKLCTLADFHAERTIYASWPKEFSLTNATKAFVDFGVEYFKKQLK